jgi:hypothetical protein
VSYVLGIDVGAARTSAAIAREGSDDVEPVDLGDGGCGVASVLHLGADGSLDVGAAAERWADEDPDRVVRGFPGRIGDDVPMLLAGEPWAPEELTAWLVRWVVDRVAESEGTAAAGVAVTRPAAWDDDRTELLAGALAEQDLDVTFLATARAAEWYPGADGSPELASAAACGAALALLAGDVGVQQPDDVASRVAALAQFPGVPVSSEPDEGLTPTEVPAPRSHHSGGWWTESSSDRTGDGHGDHVAGTGSEGSGAHTGVDAGSERSGSHAATERRATGSGAYAAAERRTEQSGAHAAGERRAEQSGAHAAGERRAEQSGAHAADRARTEEPEEQFPEDRADPESDDGPGGHRDDEPPDRKAAPDDGLFTALGGFTGTLGATNTAGLLSGYTPPSGLPLSATGGQATALVTEADELLALPTQRSGSGRWAAVEDFAEADERASHVVYAAPVERGRGPVALVSIGGAAAAVAVVATLFLWPAPRTTNSAVSRSVPLVPALT